MTCWIVGSTLLLIGCHADHSQSALHPAGPGAHEVERLWWAMFTILSGVFLGTMLLLLLALLRVPIARPRGDLTRTEHGAKPDNRSEPGEVGHDADSGNRIIRPPFGELRFVVITGIATPAVILIVLLFVSLRSTLALRLPDADLTIAITGHQWWWHVEYADHDIITANEFYIPIGKVVHLKLESADVIHSLWVPNLSGKMDLIPGRTNTFWVRADRAGRFRGQCAEFCGVQHANMALWVVALPQREFDAWIEDRRRPTPEPATEVQRRGLEVFFSEPAGCNACHAIRGTDAVARLAPDLTHIGSRLTLGAATIPNSPEALARWISDPQIPKPGNLMPETDLTPEELEAIVEYLLTLQ